MPDLPTIADFWARVDAFRASQVARSRREAATVQSQGFGLNRRKIAWNPGGETTFDRFLGVEWEHRSNFERKEATWKRKGQQYMEASGVKGANNLVYQTTAQRQASAAIIAAGLADVERGVIEAFDTTVGGHAIKTFEAWPVDIGVSKASLGLSIEMLEGSVKTTLAASAPYVIYIKEAGTRKGDNKGKRQKGLGWKRKYLVKTGDTWTFDASRYERDKEIREETGKKPTKGRPFQDYLKKPGKKLAQETAKKAVENIVRK